MAETSQRLPSGAPLSMAAASSSAPSTLSDPPPWLSVSNGLPSASLTLTAVNSRMALTALGVRPGLLCRTSAAAPLATPAAMLVPLSRM